MATVDLGKISFVNKGTYDASTTYEERDVVQFTDGALSSYVYVNATPASGQTPSTGGTVNSSHWAVFAGGTHIGVGNNKIVTTDGSGNVSSIAIGSTNQFLKVTGTNTLGFAAVDVSGRVVQTLAEVDSTEYSIGSSWSTGKTWSNITGITTGNNLKITMNIYARSDSSSWGGLYTALEFSSDGGSNYTDWRSDGYTSGNIMHNSSGGSIGQSMRVILVTNWQSTQFRLRYKHRSYDSTSTVNDNGEIDLGVSPNYNNYDSNGSTPSGITPTQWGRNSIIIEEIAT